MNRIAWALAAALLLGGAGPASAWAGLGGRQVAATPTRPWPLAAAVPFVLRSGAFENGHAIPARFTCDGANVSPDLRWIGVPHGTSALALIVDDPDARGFAHWLVYNIAVTPTGRLAAAVPRSAGTPRQGINDFGRRGYDGPCPPAGRHRYRFTLFALDHALSIPGRPRIAGLRAALKGHVIAQTVLVGTYRRP
jgi:Raf kinase inhibitor-like YbhB/YbcL family protein